MKTPWSAAEWNRVIVYGLGASGVAAMRLLLDRGVSVVAIDSRDSVEVELPAGAAVEWILGSEPEELPAGIDGLVLSPGVPSSRALVQAAKRGGIPVISEVELAFPFLKGCVLAVTGSNGKSTTVAMLAQMLRSGGRDVELCGNFGVPLCSVVDGSEERIFVVELSSFQLENVVCFAADGAALLNVAPDHMDRYPSLEAYGAAKARIFERQEKESVAVLNGDDPWVKALAGGLSAGTVRFFHLSESTDEGCFVKDGTVYETANSRSSANSSSSPPNPEDSAGAVLPSGGVGLATSSSTAALRSAGIPGGSDSGNSVSGPDSSSSGRSVIELFSISDVPVPGPHNVENAMAAALLARGCGLTAEQIRVGLRSFVGLPHRLQRVAEQSGVRWYDDSKGTNAAATERSLEGFEDATVHLILGGRSKGTDPAALLDIVSRKARRVYLIGESAGLFTAALRDCVPIEATGTMARAVERAAAMAKAGESVVLSPACSSFDQFDNFEHRGRCFQQLVADRLAFGAGRGDGQETGV